MADPPFQLKEKLQSHDHENPDSPRSPQNIPLRRQWPGTETDQDGHLQDKLFSLRNRYRYLAYVWCSTSVVGERVCSCGLGA